MRRRHLALVAGALILTGARGARAQGVVPPRAVAPTQVPYPEGATGDAEVTLELVVDRAGSVAEARVVAGAEPFASAALRVAKGWRFEPARQAGEARAARIRVQALFRAPAPSPPPPDPARPNDTPPSTTRQAALTPPRVALAPATVDSVDVRGERAPPGQTTLRAAEVRRLPGAFGDAFRSVEALPGVTPMVSGVPYFFVRGAPPGNTGYLLDGVRVPLLFHLGVGPSVVHPALLERVDFFAGGAPAQYGRATGGVLAGATHAPAGRLRGEGNLRLFDAGALVEAPFAGDRGSALIAGRYSFVDPLLRVFAPDTHVQYWDYQARATWALDGRDTLGVFAFGSYDRLDQRDEWTGRRKIAFLAEFHRLDVRFERRLPAGGRLRLAATVGHDESGQDEGASRDLVVALRTSADQPIAPGLRLRGGADAAFDRLSLYRRAGDALTVESSPQGEDAELYAPGRDFAAGLWFDAVVGVGARVVVTPGLRADLFHSQRATADRTRVATVASVDPRLSARARLTRGLTWVSALAVQHQAPSFFGPSPGVAPSGLDLGLQGAYQTSQGLEIALPWEASLSGTLFRHDYTGLVDITATCVDALDLEAAARSPCASQRVRGRTLGAELLLRRSFGGPLSGWVAYTLSRTTRDSRDGPVVAEFDRTHVLNVVASYDLGRGYRAGARLLYYTGRPYALQSNGLKLPLTPDQPRFPAFARVDLRFEKRWTLSPTASATLVFEWMNATLGTEVTSLEHCVRRGPYPTPDACEASRLGPVTVPSVGLEGAF